MTRPLFNKSLENLTDIVARNFDNPAELELVRSELAHRNTDGARRLMSGVEQRIAAIKTAKRRGYSAKRNEGKSVSSVERDISEQVKKWTNDAVAKLRAKLIDLGRKSPLISFKHASRSASQLRVVDERIDTLWEALNEGEMGFEALPGEEQVPPDEQTPQFKIAYERARLTDEQFQADTESLGDNEDDAGAWQEAERRLRSRVRDQLGLPRLNYGKGLDVAAIAKAHGFDPSFDLKFSDDGQLSSHHEDDQVRVLLTRKELDKRLKTIWDRSGSHLRETGLHTLHLVFGFVEWFEDDASDVAMYAPLLLLPVSLHREVKKGRYDYSMRATGDEIEVNIALAEKARTHWGLELPKLRDEESPESYFIRTKVVLEQGRRLRLRHFVTLAVVPPMILWKDLDPASWPDDAFAKHRVLPGLLNATEYHQSHDDDGPIDIDDPDNADMVPALITDADASQHKAIMDMAAGHDMAIEGPPGTGKSQTITNMIATALSKGKRVLFVAEKQAALRVVAERLRSLGFGPLLLELHGDRAVRSEVYDGIRERLNSSASLDSRQLEEKRAELRRHRDMLRRYLSLIREPLGELEMSAHDLAWREIRLASAFTREQITAMEERWGLENPEDLDRSTLIEWREMLQQFGQALNAIDRGSGERTRWVMAERLDAFDQSKAIDAAGAAGQAAATIATLAGKLVELGLTLPDADEDIEGFGQMLAKVRPFSTENEPIAIAALRSPEVAARLLKIVAEWREMGAELKACMADPAAATPEQVGELASAMDIANCPNSPAHVNEQHQKVVRFAQDLAMIEVDLSRVGERLGRGLDTTTDNGCLVAKTIAEMGALSPNVTSMLSSELLDPATLAVASAAESEAAKLIAEREVLLVLADTEALKVEPNELDRVADILETTGFIGRLSGSYRATKRQASRFLNSEEDRLEAARILRRISSFGRAVREFEQGNKAKILVAPLLWNGIDTDLSALKAACEAVLNASTSLIAIDESDSLSWWLSANLNERQRFASACARISPILSDANSLNFGGISLNSLPETCNERIASLHRLKAAIGSVQLNTDCPLKLDAVSVADRLSRYQKRRAEFDQIRCEKNFEWVGEITSDLTQLDVAILEVASISEISGADDLVFALERSLNPVSLTKSWSDLATELNDAYSKWAVANSKLEDSTGTEATKLTQASSWKQLACVLQGLHEDRHGASLAADLLKYREALNDHELEAFAEAAVDGLVQADQIDDLFELISISTLLRNYLGGSGSELSRLGSLSLDSARRAFKRADKDLHKLEATSIVASRLNDRAPRGVSSGPRKNHTDLSLILHEVELTRPRTPLREVVHRAGEALQVLKPVWMMSPTSVAQFIRPGELNFDTLIIDEASQMRPEYSVSCMLRADQLIVVGDANQLPPSDHFQMASANDDDDDGIGVDENTESILDLANQRFYRKPRLKWHYRSQHESLIQFSNREFYDRDLVVFPSPNSNEDELLGVKCMYVPSIHADTVYDSSINQREAEVIIEHAFGLMQSHPERSIGIVAMNAKQAELIQNEFDRLIVEDERVAKYVEAFSGGVEEFFIKNLENVQGDERDIILISTVYGPGKDGKVRQNFGLLNREVGWRRLNVLITRAKMSCRLITSLRPDDIKVTENSSKGIIALKNYLTYALKGAQYDDASGGETDSDFEIFVADAIRGAGYEVVYQVGVEKFRIDLGVRHEGCPIGFIAGIECDGAPYHSGFSVRDRDNIRQSVLEGLGWRIYRVWSTDWFADPARETAKLLAWLDAVRSEIQANLTGKSNTLQPVAVGSKKAQSEKALEKPVEPAETSALPLFGTEPEPEPERPREPKGRKLRPLDDIEPYEAVRGSLYEIWKAEKFLGEVEVIKRATANPKLYGDKVVTTRSEYEGRVATNGDRFVSYDLYAAMREVARRDAESDVP